MEKIEAIREYCIEQAITIEASKDTLRRIDAEKVVESAKKLEKYITS